MDSSGRFSGTPTATGSNYLCQVSVTDAASGSNFLYVSLAVGPPLGRNDSPASATPISNGNFAGSISPYIDPPNGPLVPGDSDYYKFLATAGTIVHVNTSTIPYMDHALDTVLEILDANGGALSTCRQPSDTGSVFSSACINDDISASPHNTDSSLDFQVPGTAGQSATYIAHVLDWRGDARPDFQYDLFVSGVVDWLSFGQNSVAGAISGVPYQSQIHMLGGASPLTFTHTGSLPTGLTMSSDGWITGTTTTTGSFPINVTVSDSTNPPQTTSQTFAVNVAQRLQMSKTAPPAGKVGQQYSFTITTTGGNSPLIWSVFSTNWLGGLTFDGKGTISGTPTSAGSFPLNVGVNDSSSPASSDSSYFTIVINP